MYQTQRQEFELTLAGVLTLTAQYKQDLIHWKAGLPASLEEIY